MAKFNYPILAKEGWHYLILSLLVAIFASFTIGYWSLLFWLVFLFVLQFFRDPKRNITEAEGAIVSPASGQIVAIEETDNPYLPGVQSLKISVFMNVFSVHSNLIPIGGTVKNVWYYEGKFLNAALDKSSTENERNAVHILTHEGKDVVSVQIAGLIARRILCYVKPGDNVATGARYGFIRFGSRVDLYLPIGTKIHVKLGQWVKSGSTQLAEL